MRTKDVFRTLAVGAAIALVATGCAGNGSNTSSGDESSDGASADLGEIKVGMASGSATWVPVYVGIEQGFFEEEGLTVNEPVQLGSGAKSAAALSGGAVDVSLGIAPDVLNLYQNGQDPVLLGTIYNAYSVDIVAGESIDVPADASLEEKVEALKGKKIGITGPASGTEALVSYLFAEQGLDAQTDAELVGLGGDPSAALNALSTGQVDALSHVLSVGQKAEDEGLGTLFISPSRGDIPAIEKTAHGTLITTQKIVDEKEEAIKAFNRAYQKSMQWFKENPEEARPILADYLAGMSDGVVDQIQEALNKSIPDTLEVDPDSWQTEIDLLTQTGLISGDLPTLEDLVNPDLAPSK